MSKLMTPLFYDGMFNRDGRKMRAVFEREVSDGTDTYCLWRSAGSPDQQYPNAENDTYILYVQIGNYLAPLGNTDFQLIDRCGFPAMVEKLYGNHEQRKNYFNQLRTLPNHDELVKKAIHREEEEIVKLGNEPFHQAGYIKSELDKRVSIYQKAKQNDGESFPDFIGALVLNELDYCVKLAAVYRKKSEEKRLKEQAKQEAEDQAYCQEQNCIAEQAIVEALQILRTDGILKNDEVRFYQSRYDSKVYSIINYLMRQFDVDVPLRTQGWINDKLVSITVKNGECENLSFRKSKGTRCSEKVWECLSDLLCKVHI